MKVKVSVIMPAYHVASYIDEAIQSVLRQKGIPFELLIADDASTDDTWKRIQSYRHNPQIRAWRLDRNRGEGATRNFLIARSRGPYISFCDADDIMLSGHLKSLVRVLDRNPEIGVVYGDMAERSEDQDRLLRRSLGPTQTWDLIDGSISHGGTLVRKSLIRKIGGYRPQFRFLGDVDLFLRLSEITKFRHLNGKPLYLYRRRPGALSDQPKEKWIDVGRRILGDAILRRYQIHFQW